MASSIETTFGARLRNAQDLVQILSRFADYTAVRPSDSVAELTILCDSTLAANNSVITALQGYNAATVARINIFKKDTLALMKLVSPIRRYVDALYGKDSVQSKQIIAIVNRIRASKPTVIAGIDGADDKKISQSEQSYGSLTQAFTDLITTLQTFTGYNPVIVHLKLASLQAAVTNAAELNDDVVNFLTTLRFARKERSDNYADLKERIIRVKALVSASYGYSSQEYKMIRGLSV